MRERTELALIGYEWIGRLPPHNRFGPSDIHRFLAAIHPVKVKVRGNAEKEKRYQNDARWAIKDADLRRLITHVKRGVWERTSKTFDAKPDIVPVGDFDFSLR